MNKKILLINPPAHFKSTSPPLGLAYLAAQLLSQGYTVKIIDAMAIAVKTSTEEILRQIDAYKPDGVGITLMTPYAQNAYRLINRIKARGFWVVAGGPHPTILPHETLEHGADVVVRGEGETTLLDLLQAHFDEGDIRGVRGISYLRNGSPIDNECRELIDNLDSLLPPEKDLFNPAWYHESGMQTNESFGTILTSRGCPGQCTFCSRAVFQNKVRYHSPEYTINQMLDHNTRYGIDRFYIMDDHFTSNKEILSAVCQHIREKLPNITWACTARVTSVNSETLAMMKSAGCTTISYGIESGSDRTLKRIKKGLTVKRIREVVKATHQLSIQVCANWIMGYPFETLEDVEKTEVLIKELDPCITMHNAGYLVPFPGTEVYEEYKYLETVEGYWLRDGIFKELKNPSAQQDALGNSILVPEKSNDYWYPFDSEMFQANVNLGHFLDNLISQKLSQRDIVKGKGIQLVSGWHNIEWWDEIPVRWTTGSAVVHVDSPSHQIRIQYRCIWQFENREISIHINGEQIYSEEMIIRNEWTDIVIELDSPQSPLDIEIHSPCLSPGLTDGSNDTRELGIAVCGFYCS